MILFINILNIIIFEIPGSVRFIEPNKFLFMVANLGSKTVLRIHWRETLILTLVGGLKIMASNVSKMITKLGTFVSTQMEQ